LCVSYKKKGLKKVQIKADTGQTIGLQGLGNDLYKTICGQIAANLYANGWGALFYLRLGM